MATRVKDWLKPGTDVAAPAKDVKDITVNYRGKEYKAAFGPSASIEQADGSLWFSDKPAIILVDPKSGEMAVGLTIQLPDAALGPNQILVCGGDEGPMALEAAGVVRCTGDRIRAEEYKTTVAVCELLVDLPFVTPFAALLRGLEEIDQQKKSSREI